MENKGKLKKFGLVNYEIIPNLKEEVCVINYYDSKKLVSSEKFKGNEMEADKRAQTCIAASYDEFLEDEYGLC